MGRVWGPDGMRTVEQHRVAPKYEMMQVVPVGLGVLDGQGGIAYA
jgi:hypothetical protein